MIALDTNVVVRHVTNDNVEQAAAAHAVFDQLTSEVPGFVSLTVLAELFWVLRRSYGFEPVRIHELIGRLLETVEVELEDEESVSRALSRAWEGADFADALIDDAADLYGCTETVTFDRRASLALGWRLLE